MGKVILAIIVVIGIVGAVLAFKNKRALAPSPSESISASENASPTVSAVSSVSPSASPSVSQITKGNNFSIIFANGSVSPDMLTIKVGDTVKFINEDDTPHWPASGPHPIHTTCPGFDALRGLTKGESYSFTFEIAKVCPFHDHLNPSIHGQITVNP